MEKKESKLYMKKKERKQEVFNRAKLIKKTCDHKIENDIALDVVDEKEMVFRCKLCGEKFSAKSMSQAELHEAVVKVLDAINCIKLKGDHGNKSYLPLETRESLAVTQLLLESIPSFYKDYYLDNVKKESYDSDFYENGPCEISTDGGLIVGNASVIKKHKKKTDIERIIGGNGKKHKKNDRDRYDDHHKKNKGKKHKKNNDWY